MSDTAPTVPSGDPAEAPVPAPSARPSTTITSRTKLSTVAARLHADYTAGCFTNNDENDLVHIKLNLDNLYSTFANSLKPIIYGSFRNIGARTLTDKADTDFLDLVLTTVATNACAAAYSVLYQKAVKIDASLVTKIGHYNPIDGLRFPALTTLMINSLGPIETDALPYRCTFVPYIEWAGVEALYGATGYKAQYNETFLQAMKRGRTVQMTDVDINNSTSSIWWTLFMDNHTTDTAGARVRKPTITAYCPFRYAERDHATTLAAFVIEDTLYEAPGPVLTSCIGPFATARNPTEVANIPEVFRDEVGLNKHVPARHVVFHHIDRLSNAGAIAFGDIQNEQAIMMLASSQSVAGTFTHNEYEDYDLFGKTKKRKTTNTGQMNLSQSSTTNVTSHVALATARTWVASVHYFDHILLDSVPLSKRNNVVTQANQID